MGKAVGSPRARGRILLASSVLMVTAVAAAHEKAQAAPGPPIPLVDDAESVHRDALGENAQPMNALWQGPMALDGVKAKHAWHLLDGKFWQIVSTAGEDSELTDAAEGGRGICPTGMIEVAGKMKRHGMMEELQNQACTNWISKTFPARCGEFDRDKWLAISKDLPVDNVHMCIDRFEYPNKKGEYPVVMLNWYEADNACKAQSKRLCSENEWTFACEGEETLPYPTGYKRDAESCVIDRPWYKWDDSALGVRNSERAWRELDRLYQAMPSGASPRCKSPFGVHDMTGNVDEWTRTSVPGERPSVLKGGYWGPVRTRCRPATKVHDQTHTFYQQGFRCCSDAKVETAQLDKQATSKAKTATQ